MADQLLEFFRQLSDLVWGVPLLVLLVGTGIYLSARLRAIQLTKLAHSLYLGLIKRKEEGDQPGDISHFQALMTALSATVGTGNIAGVATAIATGGPGALFWMWVTGLFGMATKYSEAVLAVHYREVDENGAMSGGPMYYIHKGLGMRWLGLLFAVFAAIAAFGIGNMVQSNSVAQALNHSFNIPNTWTGIILMVSTSVVIVGGIKSIGRVTGILVPFMIVFYFISASVILLIHFETIPAIFLQVIEGAFSGTAAAGGFLGASVMMTVKMGVARGVFSNESGLGSSPIAAAAAITKHPVSQALVSMTQTFIDTIIICTLTGFAIIASGLWQSDPLLTGAELTSAAFSQGLPGNTGGTVVSVGLVLFAYSTILGWSYYGEKALEFIVATGEKTKKVVMYLLIIILALPLWIVLQTGTGALYMSLFILLMYAFVFMKIRKRLTTPDLNTINILYRGTFSVYVLVGTIAELDLVWTMADVFNGLMAVPNLIGLLGLSGIVVKITNDYFKN
ncbi:MAG: alanine/glycine:cation symporter family protein [Calditrichaceae bacterium]